MRPVFILLSSLSLWTACSTSTPLDGGGTIVPSLVQTNIPYGSTGVSTNVKFLYELDNGDQSMAIAMNGALESTTAFVGADGTSVAAVVTLGPPPIPPLTRPQFSIAPSIPLLPDAWYALRFTPSTAYRIKSLDSARRRTDIVFYTGSAPRLRYLSRSKNSKGAGQYLEIKFSEPIALANIVSDGFETIEGASVVSGCVYWGTDCLTSTTDITLGGFLWRFEKALTSDPGITKIRVSDKVAGVSRAVSAAKVLSGSPVGGVTTDAGVDYNTPASEWFSCNGDALTECWESPLPL